MIDELLSEMDLTLRRRHAGRVMFATVCLFGGVRYPSAPVVAEPVEPARNGKASQPGETAKRAPEEMFQLPRQARNRKDYEIAGVAGRFQGQDAVCAKLRELGVTLRQGSMKQAMSLGKPVGGFVVTAVKKESDRVVA